RVAMLDLVGDLVLDVHLPDHRRAFDRGIDLAAGEEVALLGDNERPFAVGARRGHERRHGADDAECRHDGEHEFVLFEHADPPVVRGKASRKLAGCHDGRDMRRCMPGARLAPAITGRVHLVQQQSDGGNAMRGLHVGPALLALLLGTSAASAEDMLKVAVGARGVGETFVAELGQNAGIFKKHGLTLEILYTQGGGETQQVVISNSAQIGVATGFLGALGAFAKGAPIRVIGSTFTGGSQLFWYVPASSPIKSLRDTDGKTVAYSTNGSSTPPAGPARPKTSPADFPPPP